jgi:pyruvate dehydrogenase E1 component
VIDGHPATLAWLGSVRGHRVEALGVEHFGQTGTIPTSTATTASTPTRSIAAAAEALARRPADPVSAGDALVIRRHRPETAG